MSRITHHTSHITHHNLHPKHLSIAICVVPASARNEVLQTGAVFKRLHCVCSQIRLTLSETNLAKMNIITATGVLGPGPASTNTCPAAVTSVENISDCMNNVKAEAPIPQPKLGWTEKIIDLATSTSSQGLSEVRRSSGFYSSQLSGNSSSWQLGEVQAVNCGRLKMLNWADLIHSSSL